ncbi:glb-28, partial [Pristionchus pacificus]
FAVMLRTENYLHQSHYNIHETSNRPSSPASPSRLTPDRFGDRLGEPKPLRRTRSASPLPSKMGILSSERQTLLRRSWQRLPKQTFSDALMVDLVRKIGKHSFGDDSDAIELHRRYFMDLLASLVDNLPEMENILSNWTETISRGHLSTRIKPRDWDSFGESVMSVIPHYIGPGKHHKETVKSWTMLSSFLSDRLAAAARGNHSPNSPRLQVKHSLY